MCPPDYYSFNVQVGVNGADLETINIVEDIHPKVINALSVFWVGTAKSIISVGCLCHTLRVCASHV